MQFHATELKRFFFVLVLLGGIAAGRSWGQAPGSPIVFQGPSAITTTLVPAPTAGPQSGGGNSDNSQWLKVEWHYQVIPKDPLPYLDSVDFHVYVEGRDLYSPEATTADGLPVVLTGMVTYINLFAARDAYGVVYVHPSTLQRYSTKNGGAGDFSDKFNVHIEAFVGGAKMDIFDKNKPDDPNWFQSAKNISGLLYRQDMSPFILTDSIRYPQLKPLPTGMMQ